MTKEARIPKRETKTETACVRLTGADEPMDARVRERVRRILELVVPGVSCGIAPASVLLSGLGDKSNC